MSSVARVSPSYFFPFHSWGPYRPSSVVTLASTSHSRSNGYENFFLKAAFFSGSSLERPRIFAPFFAKLATASWKPHACFVHPGVSAAG
jgi:hypothetical protein